MYMLHSPFIGFRVADDVPGCGRLGHRSGGSVDVRLDAQTHDALRVECGRTEQRWKRGLHVDLGQPPALQRPAVLMVSRLLPLRVRQ